ncbi:hypothetical protein F2Y11_04535 [Alistipes onderdonkii]|nr:hypothetical protein F2Y11_04535 [Alistipes onderdonkii]
MLAGVGCKDYDDDIDKVNDRLDQLETGKLATLEQQIAAINSSIASLETAYKAADAELKTALEKQASDLTAAKSALESSIAALKSTHEADIAKLTGDLNALGSKVEGYNTDLKAEIKKVADDLAHFKNLDKNFVVQIFIYIFAPCVSYMIPRTVCHTGKIYCVN